MMNFLGVGSTNGNPVQIKEANEHLAQMHTRMVQLEQRVEEQGELLLRRQHEHRVEKQHIIQQHKLQVDNYQKDVLESERIRQELNGQIKQMSVQIAFLHHRCSYLEEAASYAPLLDQLSTCLKSSTSSMPPKVVSVKPITRLDLENPTPQPNTTDMSHRKSHNKSQPQTVDNS